MEALHQLALLQQKHHNLKTDFQKRLDLAEADLTIRMEAWRVHAAKVEKKFNNIRLLEAEKKEKLSKELDGVSARFNEALSALTHIGKAREEKKDKAVGLLIMDKKLFMQALVRVVTVHANWVSERREKIEMLLNEVRTKSL